MVSQETWAVDLFPTKNETIEDKITAFQWDHSLNAKSWTFPRFCLLLHECSVTLSKKAVHSTDLGGVCPKEPIYLPEIWGGGGRHWKVGINIETLVTKPNLTTLCSKIFLHLVRSGKFKLVPSHILLAIGMFNIQPQHVIWNIMFIKTFVHTVIQ